MRVTKTVVVVYEGKHGWDRAGSCSAGGRSRAGSKREKNGGDC